MKAEEDGMDCEVALEKQSEVIKEADLPSLCQAPGSGVAEIIAVQAVPELNPDLIQVRASKAEIERRINAFIERKQLELDENNKREFCNAAALVDADFTCARTDAVFIPREGSKSHVKVTRVVNKYGPQTRPMGVSPGRSQPQTETTPADRKATLGVTEAVEERLRNMESHLKLKPGHRVSHDVYDRLRLLEDRILHLESLSPEYFSHHGPPAPKRQLLDPSRQLKMEKPYYAKYQSMSLSQIDRRMQELKARLQNRQSCPSVSVKQEPPGDE